VALRRRLALYGTAVAAGGMVVFIVLFSGLGANGARDDQDRALGAMADAAVAALDSGQSTPAARPLVVVDLHTSAEPFLLVLAPDGTPRYASGVVDGAPPRIPAAVVVEAEQSGRSVATIVIGPPPRQGADPQALRIVARRWSNGLVVAGQSTTFVANQIAAFRAFLIFSAVVTLIAVAIVSWLVAGRAVRPLVTLSATTSAIGSTGDLGRRLPTSNTKDEVGRLTTSFNAMLDRLQAAQAELAAALAAQQRFVADASHELRTPLATIRTNAEFLRERPDATDADRSAAIADVASEAERMSHLVDGLLVLARADAGVAVERRPVDVRAIANAEAQRLRPSGRKSDGPGEIRIDAPGAALVSGDADALGRVIRILLDNAFRHGRPPVDMTVARADGRVRVEVHDAGAGIPPGNEERIFERFYRAEASRSPAGSGLGLAIARAIVEAHGGTVRAANATGGGAVVTMELPSL